MKICPFCGANIEDYAAKCHECKEWHFDDYNLGTKLQESSDEIVAGYEHIQELMIAGMHLADRLFTHEEYKPLNVIRLIRICEELASGRFVGVTREKSPAQALLFPRSRVAAVASDAL